MTGADGLPKPRDGGNVLRPSTTLKLSLRLPPDVDAQAATDALISAIRTDEGAHITIDLEAAAQGWIAPPLESRRGRHAARPSRRSASGARRASSARAAPSRSWPTCRRGSPARSSWPPASSGPHSNAHGPNESLHIPMAKAVTHAVAALLRDR